MIKVNVEEYCHQCLDFCSDVIEPMRIRSGDNKEPHWSDTLIQCKYRKRCAGIKRYLEQQMKGEVSG